MNTKRLIFTPGDYLTQRFDEGYAKFVEQIKRGRLKFGLTTLLVPSAARKGFKIRIFLRVIGHR